MERTSDDPQTDRMLVGLVADPGLAAAVAYRVADELPRCWPEIEVTAEQDTLRVRIRDDGVGGAALGRQSGHGTGLDGLKDWLESLGGQIFLHSPPGAGTSRRAELPISEQNAL